MKVLTTNGMNKICFYSDGSAITVVKKIPNFRDKRNIKFFFDKGIILSECFILKTFPFFIKVICLSFFSIYFISY